MKEKLSIIKVGGKIIEDEVALQQLLIDFSELEGNKVLVHGGGRLATTLATKLGIPTKMVNGRRITDDSMLKIITMVYAGWVNKQIVAKLQALDVNALGLTGADLNFIFSEKRPIGEIDYGLVGDVKKVDVTLISNLIEKKVVPVVAPVTHDKTGNLLNTNADTIAAEVAKAFAEWFEVTLIFCFEKKGVLLNEEDEESVIIELNSSLFEQYVAEKVIQGGMIPKLQNSFDALKAGVKEVWITRADQLNKKKGTKITL